MKSLYLFELFLYEYILKQVAYIILFLYISCTLLLILTWNITVPNIPVILISAFRYSFKRTFVKYGDHKAPSTTGWSTVHCRSFLFLSTQPASGTTTSYRLPTRGPCFTFLLSLVGCSQLWHCRRSVAGIICCVHLHLNFLNIFVISLYWITFASF